jgi:hypothetical protein
MKCKGIKRTIDEDLPPDIKELTTNMCRELHFDLLRMCEKFYQSDLNTHPLTKEVMLITVVNQFLHDIYEIFKESFKYKSFDEFCDIMARSYREVNEDV